MDLFLEKLCIDLEKKADEKIRVQGEKFFKEAVKIRGIRNAVVTATGKEHYKVLPDKSKENVFRLCEELWQTGFIEDSFIACQWSYNVRKYFKPSDLQIFETWIARYVSNWASCDTFCNHTVGALIEMYPEFLDDLKRWAKSDNRWIKRASAVSLIIPARKGKFLEDIFKIADILHSDKDDMVQKGYGWMLKVASQAHQEEVFEYVMSKKKTMPRTALRYAIEKMPPELRAEAMTR